MTCSIPGCTAAHLARGLCSTHRARWQRGQLEVTAIDLVEALHAERATTARLRAELVLAREAAVDVREVAAEHELALAAVLEAARAVAGARDDDALFEATAELTAALRELSRGPTASGS